MYAAMEQAYAAAMGVAELAKARLGARHDAGGAGRRSGPFDVLLGRTVMRVGIGLPGAVPGRSTRA